MNLYSDYDLVFEEWLENGIIERAETQDIMQNKTRVHYLPHRVVVNEGRTTRIRPVFDASHKDNNGYCLNDCLGIGPNRI